MDNYLDHIFDSVDPSIHLDLEQKRVIVTEGDLLVIAGAGSGKTTTMVAKVKYLIEKKQVDPKEILLISYTNKATEELKNRIQSDFNLPISIMTFHKFGLSLLQTKNIETNSYTIIKKIIEQMLQDPAWKYKIKWYARKYKQNNFQGLIQLSEQFLKNYKIKGNPPFKTLPLSSFWTRFLETVYIFYQQKMKGKLDFEDMIIEATKKVNKREVSFFYRYIIVDEYQDISQDRFLLLLALKKQYSCTLIAVGDDFQSIFGFTGSEIGLFTNFLTFFSDAKQLKITNTYRNSQELIDIAGSFVMKNTSQIQKQLSSPKHELDPIILVPYWNHPNKQLLCILKYISKKRQHSYILLLGRFYQDFKIEEYPYLKQESNQIICPEYPNLKLEFLTVHSAKGLGADEVILLNCNRGIYGFPSKKKSDPILKSVESIDFSYPDAEERRLFYVALTRTKNQVFLMYHPKKISKFVMEIKKQRKLPLFNQYEMKK